MISNYMSKYIDPLVIYICLLLFFRFYYFTFYHFIFIFIEPRAYNIN